MEDKAEARGKLPCQPTALSSNVHVNEVASVGQSPAPVAHRTMQTNIYVLLAVPQRCLTWQAFAGVGSARAHSSPQTSYIDRYAAQLIHKRGPAAVLGSVWIWMSFKSVLYSGIHASRRTIYRHIPPH